MEGMKWGLRCRIFPNVQSLDSCTAVSLFAKQSKEATPFGSKFLTFLSHIDWWELLGHWAAQLHLPTTLRVQCIIQLH